MASHTDMFDEGIDVDVVVGVTAHQDSRSL